MSLESYAYRSLKSGALLNPDQPEHWRAGNYVGLHGSQPSLIVYQVIM